MAVVNGEKDKRVTAGLIIGWVYDNKGNKIGGLVAEYHGSDEENVARDSYFFYIFNFISKEKV